MCHFVMANKVYLDIGMRQASRNSVDVSVNCCKKNRSTATVILRIDINANINFKDKLI